MYYLKLSTFLLVVAVSLSCLDGLQTAPTRSSELSKDSSIPSSVWKSWMIPVLRKRTLTRSTPAFPEEELFKEKSFHVNKRTCNTGTCVTQRLADFLSRSNKNLGPFYIPTNVGSNTYGKRDGMGSYTRNPLNYL